MIAIDDMPILAQTTGMRTYEEICEDSRIAVKTSDNAGWRIGDNAIEVTERYGDHTLADYAREIGKPKSTVYEAASMSTFWIPQVRSEIAEDCPNVTRSHMRKVLFMHDADKARWAVEKCSERGWTVDQFGYILKRYKSLKGLAPRASKSDQWTPLDTFSCNAGAVQARLLDMGLNVTSAVKVTVYVLKEAK